MVCVKHLINIHKKLFNLKLFKFVINNKTLYTYNLIANLIKPIFKYKIYLHFKFKKIKPDN